MFLWDWFTGVLGYLGKKIVQNFEKLIWRLEWRVFGAADGKYYGGKIIMRFVELSLAKGAAYWMSGVVMICSKIFK